MNVAFTIPIWLLWCIGIPLGISIIGLAILGIIFIWFFRSWFF
jgi:hypothetical protein